MLSPVLIPASLLLQGGSGPWETEEHSVIAESALGARRGGLSFMLPAGSAAGGACGQRVTKSSPAKCRAWGHWT